MKRYRGALQDHTLQQQRQSAPWPGAESSRRVILREHVPVALMERYFPCLRRPAMFLFALVCQCDYHWRSLLSARGEAAVLCGNFAQRLIFERNYALALRLFRDYDIVPESFPETWNLQR